MMICPECKKRQNMMETAALELSRKDAEIAALKKSAHEHWVARNAAERRAAEYKAVLQEIGAAIDAAGGTSHPLVLIALNKVNAVLDRP